MPRDYQDILQEEALAIQNLLPSLSSNLQWSRERIELEQETKLRGLLSFAKENSPYYKKTLAHIKPEEFRLSDLAAIPIMTKKEVMEHWDEIVTDPQLSLMKTSDFLMRQTDSELLLDNYHTTATGGSSGLRGVFPWDIEEFIHFVAVFFRFQFRDGLMKQPKKKLVTAAITAQKPVHLSRFVFTVPLCQNMKILHLPAITPIHEMITQLEKHQPTHLIGYTSEIYRLAQEANRGKLNISPQRVSVNSEPLYPEMLELILKVWEAPVTNMWGSSDVGPHAQSCDRTHNLHLNEDMLIFEATDAQYIPVNDGIRAEKVLITNLFRKSMPLFRYEIDDCVTLLKDICTCGSAFKLVQSIQGRNDDAFVYENGVCIIPEVFENIIFPQTHVDEYQILQTEDGALVRLVTSGHVDLDAIKNALIRDFQNLQFNTAKIEVSLVKALERHADTGKLKRFIKKG